VTAAAPAPERREYEMSEERHKRLLDACRPVPYIVVGGVPPTSPQENANAAWRSLADELGFDWTTVKPVPGKSSAFFTAVPTGTGPIVDRVDVAKGLDLLGRKREGRTQPYACCPRDGEPLIATMMRVGAEFVCLVCGTWYGFLSPTAKDPTPELDARYAEIKARWDAGERPA
jgi:hypothetical protein